MARRLIIACVIAAAALTAFLVTRVKHSPCDDDVPEDVCNVSTALGELYLPLRSANRVLRHHARLDSLLAILPAGPGTFVALPDGVPDSTIDAYRAVIVGEMPDTLHARIGVFVVPRSVGEHPDYPLDSAIDEHEGPEMYAGVSGGTPYCVIVQPLDHNVPADRIPRMLHFARRATRSGVTMMRGCHLWASYGAPGPHVDRWLRDGAYTFAMARSLPSYEKIVERTTDPFGPSYYMSGDGIVAAIDCLGGDVPTCDRIFLKPGQLSGNRRWLAGSPAAHVPDANSWQDLVFGTNDVVILADLERYYGRERFERFWRSNDDVPIAFAAAFGTSPGEWLMQWAQARFEPIESTPRLDLENVMLSLLTVVILFGISVSVTSRRQIQ